MMLSNVLMATVEVTWIWMNKHSLSQEAIFEIKPEDERKTPMEGLGEDIPRQKEQQMQRPWGQEEKEESKGKEKSI